MLDYLLRSAQIVDGSGAVGFTGDVGIKDGLIVDVGRVSTKAKEIIDADGALVTPGWIDVHTHYDGQVTWDDQLDPSASHGVTTVVMGNCGVGFAPVQQHGERELIEMMEGVEDIPGTALYEGMPWGEWETFPEYLDYLSTREYAIDVGAQLAHGALRSYVMGERGRNNDPATSDDIARMSSLVEEALRAGAVGISTSRTIGHRSISGVPVPGTFAEEDEVLALANAVGNTGAGVFELIPASATGAMPQFGGEKFTIEEEFELIKKIAFASKRPVTFTTIQVVDSPRAWQEILAQTALENAKGARIRPQVASRPIGLVSSLQTYHMFERRETYLKLANLPLADRVHEMRKPEVKAAILSDRNIHTPERGVLTTLHAFFKMMAKHMYPITTPIDYEPDVSKTLGAIARNEGRDVQEVMYDFLVSNGGKSYAIHLGANYRDNNHEVIREMLCDENTVVGLSDAGAHVNLIFDAVAPTYQLTHWVRDRCRGDRLPLELIVNKQTQNNAELYGLHDRGAIEAGKRADINVIDFENLSLGELDVRSDLPAGGSRILQGASGYIATFVNGVRTRRLDSDTGARPGRLVRGSSPSR